MKQYGDALEVAHEAANQTGRAMKFASEESKAGQEVALGAVNQNRRALEWAFVEPRADKRVVLSRCGLLCSRSR